MKDLKAMKAKAQALNSAITGIEDKLDAARQANKPDEVKALEAELKGKSEEFDTLDAEIRSENARAEARAKRDGALSIVDKLAAPAGGGKEIIPSEKPAAEAVDHGKEEREAEGLFFDALEGKSLPDQARDMFTPKNQSWGANASRGIVLPQHLALALLPEAFGMRGKALPMTSVGSGQYTMAREFHAELLRYRPESPVLFPNVRQVPTSTGKAEWPRLKQKSNSDQYGGVVCTWTAEGSDKTDTEPTIEQVQVDAYELSAYTELTRTLLRRSGMPLEQLMQELFRLSILGYLDAAILSGNGASKPLGLLDDASGIGTTARAEADKISRDDLIAMTHDVPVGARAAGGFILADEALEYLEKQVNAMGVPVHPVNPATGRLESLVGRPIIGVHSSGTLGDAGDVIFGDPKQYIAAVDQEIVFASSDQYKFKAGRTAYAIFMLVGGKPGVPEAFTQLDDPAQA